MIYTSLCSLLLLLIRWCCSHGSYYCPVEHSLHTLSVSSSYLIALQHVCPLSVCLSVYFSLSIHWVIDSSWWDTLEYWMKRSPVFVVNWTPALPLSLSQLNSPSNGGLPLSMCAGVEFVFEGGSGGRGSWWQHSSELLIPYRTQSLIATYSIPTRSLTSRLWTLPPCSPASQSVEFPLDGR